MNRIDYIEMEQMKKNVVPFKPGDTVLLDAFGGGVTYGAVLLRW